MALKKYLKINEVVVQIAYVEAKRVTLLGMNLLGRNFLVCGENVEEGFAAELVPMIFAGYNFYVSYVVLRCFYSVQTSSDRMTSETTWFKELFSNTVPQTVVL